MSIPQIQSIIQDVLQRAAKPGEAETWNALLQSNQVTLDGIVDGNVNSAEATTTVDPVIRLFQGVYGRVPDKGGLDYWVDVYRGLKATDNPNTPTVNEALVALARPFVDPVSTPEFATRYGTNPDGSAYVAALYFNVLGRPADQAGLLYWEGVYNAVLQQQIGKGLSASAAALETRAVLLEQFISSAEFISTSDPFITQFLTGAAQQVDPTGLYTGSLFNDKPTDITVTGGTVAENVPAGTVVATLSSVDVDFGQTPTFTITNDPSGYFAIVGNQIVVKAGVTVDFEAGSTRPVTVQVSDGAGGTYSEVINVAITNLNEAPTAIAPGAASVNENALNGAVVTSLSTTDPDAAQTFSYQIVSGNTGNAFAINGSNIVVNGALNFEGQSSYTLTVRSTDQGGLSTTRDIVVSVNNLNEAPTALALSNDRVNENVAGGTLVATLSSTDQDIADTHTYSIVGGSNDFEIIGNQIFVKAGAAIDFEAQSAYPLTIRTTDAGGLSFDRAVTINVNNANEAPTDIDLQFSALGGVQQNAAPGTVIATLSGTDPDVPAQALTFSLATPSNLFAINGNQLVVAPGAVITPGTNFVNVRVTDPSGLSYIEQFAVPTIQTVFNFTENLDNLQGSGANDTFVGSHTLLNSTINSGDQAAGGDGTDTVIINSSGLNPLRVNGLTTTSIERAVAVNQSPITPLDVSATGFANTTEFVINQSQSTTIFSDIQASAFSNAGGMTMSIVDVVPASNHRFDFDLQALQDAAIPNDPRNAGQVASQTATLGLTEVQINSLSLSQNFDTLVAQDADLETLRIQSNSFGAGPGNVNVIGSIEGRSLAPTNQNQAGLQSIVVLGGATANLVLGDAGFVNNNVEDLGALGGVYGGLTNWQTLTSIDASAFNRNLILDLRQDTIGNDWDGTATMGSGNDIVGLWDSLNDGTGTVAGGAGFDAAWLDDESSTALGFNAAQLSGIEEVIFTGRLGAGTGVVEVDTLGVNDLGVVPNLVLAGNLLGSVTFQDINTSLNVTFNNRDNAGPTPGVTNNEFTLTFDFDGNAQASALTLDLGTSGNNELVDIAFAPTGGEVPGDAAPGTVNLTKSGGTIDVDFDNTNTGPGTSRVQVVTIGGSSAFDVDTYTVDGADPDDLVSGGYFQSNVHTLNASTNSGGVDARGFGLAASGAGVAGNGASATGGSGNDQFRGSAGDDILLGNAGADSIEGNGGNDSIEGGSQADVLFGNGGNDSIGGGDGDDDIVGGAGNDVINGGANDDSIYGDDASVTNPWDLAVPVAAPNLGTGNDSIDAGSGNDSVTAGNGNDTVLGNTGNDQITGNAGNDSLQGGAGRDSLEGGTGNDTIDGRTGEVANGNATVDGDLLIGDGFLFDPPDVPAGPGTAGVYRVDFSGFVERSDFFRLVIDTNGAAAGGAVTFDLFLPNTGLPYSDTLVRNAFRDAIDNARDNVALPANVTVSSGALNAAQIATLLTGFDASNGSQPSDLLITGPTPAGNAVTNFSVAAQFYDDTLPVAPTDLGVSQVVGTLAGDGGDNNPAASGLANDGFPQVSTVTVNAPPAFLFNAGDTVTATINGTAVSVVLAPNVPGTYTNAEVASLLSAAINANVTVAAAVTATVVNNVITITGDNTTAFTLATSLVDDTDPDWAQTFTLTTLDPGEQIVVVVDVNAADAVPGTAYTANTVAQFIADYSVTFQGTYGLTLFSSGSGNLSFIDVNDSINVGLFDDGIVESLTVSIAGGSGVVTSSGAPVLQTTNLNLIGFDLFDALVTAVVPDVDAGSGNVNVVLQTPEAAGPVAVVNPPEPRGADTFLIGNDAGNLQNVGEVDVIADYNGNPFGWGTVGGDAVLAGPTQGAVAATPIQSDVVPLVNLDKIAFTTQAGSVVNYFEFANTASNYGDALATANGLFGASAVAGVAKYAAFSYNAGAADNGDLTYNANENFLFVFADTDGNGVADGAVRLLGYNDVLTQFTFTDIISA